MKGRPRKPDALKALQGNAGHRADDGRAELTLPEGAPSPPEFLSPGARQEWFRLVGELSKVRGLLCAVDAAPIGVYCSYYDQWQQAERDIPLLQERIRALEVALETAPTRTKAERTKLDVMVKQLGRALNDLNTAKGDRNKARREMRAYITELGGSPAARARIRVPNGQLDLPGMGGQPESPFERSQRLAGA